MLMHAMAEHLKSSHNGKEVPLLLERAEEARRQSDIIRKLGTEREPLPQEP